MQKAKENILDVIGRKDGMTVPEGYFEDFQKRMEAMLPRNEAAESTAKPQPPRTFFHRVRPYIYMAAMFAGIWCMIKMFSMMGSTSVDLSIDKHEVLSSALSDEDFVYEYILDDVSEREMLDEMYNDSISILDMTPPDSLDEAAH